MTVREHYVIMRTSVGVVDARETLELSRCNGVADIDQRICRQTVLLSVKQRTRAEMVAFEHRTTRPSFNGQYTTDGNQCDVRRDSSYGGFSCHLTELSMQILRFRPPTIDDVVVAVCQLTGRRSTRDPVLSCLLKVSI